MTARAALTLTVAALAVIAWLAWRQPIDVALRLEGER